MTEAIKCGNCGFDESATPKQPEEGKCGCMAWTDAALLQERRARLVRQTQKRLGVLDVLSLYGVARLDLAYSAKARAALKVLADSSYQILAMLGKDVERPVAECPICEGTGILEILDSSATACDCEEGERLYQ